jgi:transposase
VFGEKLAKESGPYIQTMQTKIGQVTLENDLLENALTKAGMLSARRCPEGNPLEG